MQGLGVQQATTTLGTIRLAGQTTIEDYDHLAGRIQITPAKNEMRTVEEWTSTCDNELANILLIISLAEAKLIDWSIRQSATTHGTLFRTDFYGPKHTGTPGDIIFHWLNLQSVVDLAVTKYTDALRQETGIELAIRLLLAQPGYIEFQLVAAITALAHLVDVYEKQHVVPPPLPKAAFRRLRKALEQAYKEASATLPQPSEPVARQRLQNGLRRVLGRIGNLNRVAFPDELVAMLDAYAVPLVGIRDHIPAAIDARNAILHEGKANEEHEELTLHVAVLRELLKRIILTLLQYKGQYISFLNGQEFLEFPP